MDRDEWNRRYGVSELVWTAQPNRFLVAETSELPPGRALDLACGEGRNAVWLAERGWQVTGVDFAEAGLEKARALTASRGVACEWIAADLLDYRPPEGAFELVIVFYLHLLADERRTILGRAARAVAPGGTLLLVGHHARNLDEGVGGPHSLDVLYTEEDVAAELPGLELERAESVLRPVETDEGTRQAIDALVRARRASPR
jgi:SAM-dependent methyltransferase